MMPPELQGNNIPYKLYNMGGVAFNFIASLLMLICLVITSFHVLFNVFLVAFSIVGIIYGLFNLIPMKISGIANDGYNLRMLIRDPLARYIFNIQLRINGMQTKGTHLTKMPIDWFDIPQNVNMNNSLHLSMFLLRSTKYVEELKFDNAYECLKMVFPYKDSLVGLYQLEMKCDWLFLEIMGECRQDLISRLYTDEVKEYIEKYQNYIFSKKRILYTYTLLVNQKTSEAQNLFDEAIIMKESYPNLGEAEAELGIMKYVKNIFA